MSRKLNINYNETFETKHSRDYYRGKSFHFSGKWVSGAHYISDDYNIDFVVHDQVFLACAKSHLSTLDNEPKHWIRDDRGTIIGVASTYWDFILAGIKGSSPGVKIVDNYWYICEDINVPEEEQVWTNTGSKAKLDFDDLTPEEIEILQQPGIEVVSNFVNNVITQETGQNVDRLMSQKASTDSFQPKGDYATSQRVAVIENKIPSNASSSNQLADKAFVEDLVSTNSATFRGTYDTLAELEAQEADENDYGFVRGTDSSGNSIYFRYKYNGSAWIFEYDITNTRFTATQQAAIDSGITDELVDKLDALPDNTTLEESISDVMYAIEDVQSDFETFVGRTDNPHNVSKAQVGLGNVNNTSDADKPISTLTQLALDKKVDKVTGKQLSTEDYTSEEKIKLASIETSAQVNVLEGVQVNNVDLTIDSNKKVNVVIPTLLSDLSSDSGHRTITDSEKSIWNAKYDKPSGGITTSDLSDGVNSSLEKADTAIQPDDLIPITSVIPNQASSSNQLADKDFVNSSIATSTATFRGTSAAGLTQAQFEAWLTTLIAADDNDYVYWNTTDAVGNVVFKRYKYNGSTWIYEYDLNNSSFTAVEQAAIQSGITDILVAKLSALPTNADLTASLNGKVDKVTGKQLSTEDYTTTEKNKLAGISDNAEVNVQSDWNVSDSTSDAYIKNKPTNIVQDASYVHTDNNYTTTEKTKLTGIADNAQVNILEGVQLDGTDLSITDKKVNLPEYPSTLDDLTNGTVNKFNDYTETKTDQTFTFRQVADGQLEWNPSAATIQKIKGNSLVWNQLVTIFTTSITKTENGINFTDNRDGTYTVQTIAEGASASTTLELSLRNIVQGHKYLLKGCPKGGSPTSFYIKISSILFSGSDDFGEGSIKTALNSYATAGWPRINIESGAIISQPIVFRPMFIDLTLMFGAGKEPATVEEFEKMFPLPYYDYNVGEIISNKTEAVESVGFNQWDEEWEVGGYKNADGSLYEVSDRIRNANPIRVLPNKAYYNQCPVMLYFYMYDINMRYLGFFGSYKAILSFTEGTAYINIVQQGTTTYSNNICINISDPARNGTYEPYKKRTLNLGLDSFKVKDGQDNIITITGGLKSAGDVYDEIVGNKYIKRIGSVNLGNLEWSASSLEGVFVSYNIANTIAFICSKYLFVDYNDVTDDQGAGEKMEDGTLTYRHGSNNDRIYVKDSTYVNYTGAQFKSAMSGVMLYYALATPVEYELVEPLTSIMPTSAYGTEMLLPENGSVPTTSPIIADISYGVKNSDIADNVLSLTDRMNNLSEEVNTNVLKIGDTTLTEAQLQSLLAMLE